MVYALHWGMRIFTFFKGNFVGQDEEGNQYYQERFWGKAPRRPLRRWVVYKGVMEGSRIPAEWFGWLHHMQDDPLDKTAKKAWQKSHQSNMTGTAAAYRPEGHALIKSKKTDVLQSYNPWKPN